MVVKCDVFNFEVADFRRLAAPNMDFESEEIFAAGATSFVTASASKLAACNASFLFFFGADQTIRHLRRLETEDVEEGDRESTVSFGRLGDANAATPGGSAPETIPKPENPKLPKAEKKRCGLCRLMQPIDDWPIGCPRCRICKRAIDNLTYCAHVQKQDEWWKEVRKDEPQLRELVKKYLEQCPDAGNAASKKRGLFNLVRYIENFKASSAVINDDEGVMMHKSRFLAWAQTEENPDGAQSKAQAEQKWSEMEESASTGQWVSSQKGPPKEPLLLRIKVADKVTFRNSFEHAKIQEAQQNREMRKVSTESLEAGRRSLLKDHDRGIGRDGQHQDFGAIAQSMVASSTSSAAGGAARTSAFAGHGVFMPNLEGMKDEIAEDQQEELEKKEAKKNQKNGAKGSAGLSGSNPENDSASTKLPENLENPAGSAAKKPWFDEGAISRAKRSQEQTQRKLVETLEKQFAAAVNALNVAASALKPDIAERELNTLKTRLKFLMAILGYDVERVHVLTEITPEQYSLHLAKYVDEEQKSKLEELKASVAGGRSPCIDYESLEPVDIISADLAAGFATLLDKATSKDDVTRFCKTLEARRAPFAKLCKAVGTASKDLTSALNSKKRVANQAQAAADQAANATPKRARVATPLAGGASRKAAIFEVGVAHGKQVETVPLSADFSPDVLAHTNFGLPVLLTTGHWQPLFKDSSVQAAISQFQSAWMTSAMRQASGRAAQKLVEPASKTVSDAFTKPLKHLMCSLPADSKYDSLRASLAPSLCAAAAGCEHAYCEKDGSASIRLAVQGTREVVLLRPCTLKSCITNGSNSLSKLCTGLLTAPATAFQGITAEIFCATVGANDLLYTPPGWIIAERIHTAPNKNCDVT